MSPFLKLNRMIIMAKKDIKKESKNGELVEIVFDIKKLEISPTNNTIYGILCERINEKMVGKCDQVIYDAMKKAGKCD